MKREEDALARLRRKNEIEFPVTVWRDEWRKRDREAEHTALVALEHAVREQRESLE